MSELSKRKQNHKRCRFCDWLADWEAWKKTEEGKARAICENRSWIALLDKFPKVEGDTLVISRKPYDDIADTLELSIEETYDFFEIVRNITGRMIERLNAEKVYAMSICEHWEEREISYTDKKTSEHLHFHLIPRYKWMKEATYVPKLIRGNGFLPERVFMIEGNEASTEDLLKTKNKLCFDS